MTQDLVAFLCARLAEDEERQKNPLTAWHGRDCACLPEPGQYTFKCDCGVPERLLAEVASDLRLIDDFVAAQAIVDASDHPDMYDVGRAQGLEEAVQLRTVRYAGHEDYREEWRP